MKNWEESVCAEQEWGLIGPIKLNGDYSCIKMFLDPSESGH